jgi:hypothetical protein
MSDAIKLAKGLVTTRPTVVLCGETLLSKKVYDQICDAKMIEASSKMKPTEAKIQRAVRVANGIVSFVEMSKTDVLYLPFGVDFSQISESDWLAKVGEPVGEETFDERQQAFIKSMGWKLDGDR